MPALRSDWQPMMLRVRPAQFTTTSVSGSGARSWMRQASSAPGHVDAARDAHALVFLQRARVEDHHLLAAMQLLQLGGVMRGVS